MCQVPLCVHMINNISADRGGYEMHHTSGSESYMNALHTWLEAFKGSNRKVASRRDSLSCKNSVPTTLFEPESKASTRFAHHFDIISYFVATPFLSKADLFHLLLSSPIFFPTAGQALYHRLPISVKCNPLIGATAIASPRDPSAQSPYGKDVLLRYVKEVHFERSSSSPRKECWSHNWPCSPLPYLQHIIISLPPTGTFKSTSAPLSGGLVPDDRFLRSLCSRATSLHIHSRAWDFAWTLYDVISVLPHLRRVCIKLRLWDVRGLWKAFQRLAKLVPETKLEKVCIYLWDEPDMLELFSQSPSSSPTAVPTTSHLRTSMIWAGGGMRTLLETLAELESVKWVEVFNYDEVRGVYEREELVESRFWEDRQMIWGLGFSQDTGWFLLLVGHL
ncbi:hypothetical protein I350_07562 [Cryptococcus amylolentus CBS 6273]|uniref:Uncharacterized protein n=1 Tax=Cryptococcus amylolentus CBS 6273 TaxID=1296118 RepID=A0A1E3JCT8_9TREE|nr:hypothetical protein I350_07562 [Cryptococcus amylolentus CBS 6273]